MKRAADEEWTVDSKLAVILFKMFAKLSIAQLGNNKQLQYAMSLHSLDVKQISVVNEAT